MSLASNIHELLLGGGTTSTYSYTINNSLRFRSSASAYLSRTPASASNRTTWTWSGWIKRGTLGANQTVFESGNGAGIYTLCWFSNSDQIQLLQDNGSGGVLTVTTNAVFRDPSSWYHVVISVDTTQATSNNRTIIYVNGVNQSLTYSIQLAQNANTWINSTYQFRIAGRTTGSSLSNIYLAEVNFIDGLALGPTYFGATNYTTGTWAPKRYSGSYGTNGFYLPFSDTSGLTSGSNAGIGKDFSGNGNYWTTNNISLTAGSTYDAMLDSPTPNSSTVGNYAVLNPLNIGSASSVYGGNLNFTSSSASGYWYQSLILSNIAVSSGKWYWEFSPTSLGGIYKMSTGIGNPAGSPSLGTGFSPAYSYWGYDGTKNNNGTTSSYGATWGVGDIIGVALDLTSGQLTYYKNGVSQGVAATGISGTFIASASTGESGQTHTGWFNFGQRPFAYTPPTGFNALQTYNLPTPTIKKGNQYFDATTYTGNGSTQSITNSGFQPDLVWAKQRNGINSNTLFDSVRGVFKYLYSNATTAEVSDSSTLTAFNVNGFSVSSAGNVNTNAATYVAWQWKASGTAVTNTAGSISSQVSANPTAGFSVVTYTGTGSAATVGHGLGVAPSMVIVKARSLAGENWIVGHSSVTNAFSSQLNLNSTAAYVSSTNFNSTNPTASVFSIGSGTAVNSNTNTYVAYCFAAIPGYSAFGSYTGNGSTDGAFVNLGFLPRFMMVKRTDTTSNWVIVDSSRNVYNPQDLNLYPNLSAAEDDYTSTYPFDMLSNGVKFRANYGNVNASGGTYIYAAFASNPFQYSLAR